MTAGLATLIGWTSCFAVALGIAWSRRPRARLRGVAVWVAAVAAAALLGMVGTTLLAAGALAWGIVVGVEVQRDSAAVGGYGRSVRVATALGDGARRAWASAMLVLVWLCVAAVGLGTVVRLYVTFGADLSRHPEYGVSSAVLRALFVEQPVIPLLLGLALALDAMLEVTPRVHLAAQAPSRAARAEGDQG